MGLELSQAAFLCDLVEQILVEEAEDLPGLKHLHQAFLLVDVIIGAGALEDESYDEGHEAGELVDVLPLHTLHDGVHNIQVDELKLLVLLN